VEPLLVLDPRRLGALLELGAVDDGDAHVRLFLGFEILVYVSLSK
jgi:hypothetical protein